MTDEALLDVTNFFEALPDENDFCSALLVFYMQRRGLKQIPEEELDAFHEFIVKLITNLALLRLLVSGRVRCEAKENFDGSIWELIDDPKESGTL